MRDPVRRPPAGSLWRTVVSALTALAAAGPVSSAGGAAGVPAAGAELFESKVRPVLVESCGKCHGAAKQASGLRLDSREALIEGGVNGAAVVPGDPEASLLVRAIRQTHEDIKMPPKGKLPADAVEAVAAWIKMGAPWPNAVAQADSAQNPGADHWAFRPVRRVAEPEVKDKGWVKSPVDAFILSALEGAGLSPSPEAERRVLIRRATFDLTGLPPTPEEVEAFLNDRGPGAYERLVDRLLASPRYGERWGRHWLDVARYADTKGYVFNQDRRYPYAYTYRDYVIRAFNEDKPYDAFVREQLAADRLGGDADKGALAALGFITVGRRYLNNPQDIIDDRIDVVTRGLLGLTVACARCHDHKFDPIPTDDYYSLYGVFAGSIEPEVLPEIPASVPPSLAEDFRAKVAEKQKAIDDFLSAKRLEIEGDFRDRAGLYLAAALDVGMRRAQARRDPKFDERANRDKLSPARLRAFSAKWAAALDAFGTRPEPVLAAWVAFASLPEAEFAAKAAGVAAKLKDDPGACNPVVAGSFVETPPGSMSDVAARYGVLLAEARSRAQRRSESGDDPGWSELAKFLDAADGPFAVALNAGVNRVFDRAESNALLKLSNPLAKLKATHPGSPPRAMVVNDAADQAEPRVFLRGNPGRPGKQVPRQFLKLLSGPERVPFKDGSGRLELARAIARADNPLTARVMVNRVWLDHFGTGLVGTPSDFGVRSDPPSHPALLDWLADDFVKNGWSVKALHRRIMLSSAYRQRSENRSEAQANDPTNRLYWKFNRRRLDFESTRDAILAASGALDSTMGGLSVPLSEPPFTTRRTVYGYIDRLGLDVTYRTFDFASPDASSPKRLTTTVPQQALFLMNSPFVIGQARALAAREELATGGPEPRVRRLYARLFGREPEPGELSLGVAFLRGRGEAAGLTPGEKYAQVLLLTNEFAFVD